MGDEGCEWRAGRLGAGNRGPEGAAPRIPSLAHRIPSRESGG